MLSIKRNFLKWWILLTLVNAAQAGEQWDWLGNFNGIPVAKQKIKAIGFDPIGMAFVGMDGGGARLINFAEDKWSVFLVGTPIYSIVFGPVNNQIVCGGDSLYVSADNFLLWRDDNGKKGNPGEKFSYRLRQTWIMQVMQPIKI